MCKSTKNIYQKVKDLNAPLLPDRHPIQDFFVCDIMDAAPKDDMASMEHPIFSLSTKPDRRLREYEHNGNKIKISPSYDGLATIHDKDILIFCISQIIAKMNRGETPNRTVHLKAYDLLVATNRRTDGRAYEQLKAAFERLRGTSITTDIKTGDERIIHGFGLIDSWKIVAKDKQSERMVSLSITLSEWMYNSVIGKEVLTLSRDYFRLRKPIERRIYEMARKHCGSNNQWKISIDTLIKKTGSSSPRREFRRMIRELIQHNHLPDYTVELSEDTVIFYNRRTVKKQIMSKGELPSLPPHILEQAKKIAPRYDVYALEADWRAWCANSGKVIPDNPYAAFLGFCKQRNSKY